MHTPYIIDPINSKISLATRRLIWNTLHAMQLIFCVAGVFFIITPFVSSHWTSMEAWMLVLALPLFWLSNAVSAIIARLFGTVGWKKDPIEPGTMLDRTGLGERLK